jgi:ribonuclease HII
MDFLCGLIVLWSKIASQPGMYLTTPMLSVRSKQDSLLEAGVDEAGRGCLWGPLYAAAVLWPPEEEWMEEHREIAPQIQDSKKLTPRKRAYLASAIQSLAMDTGIGVVSASEIDLEGISRANKLAFQRALQALSITPDRILLDGVLPLDRSTVTDLEIQEQVTVVDGDALYLPIAAASILAKEARDAAVLDAVTKDPSLDTKYSLHSSKGYGTEAHRKGILTHGRHPEHRGLFLRRLLGTTSDCLIQDE